MKNKTTRAFWAALTVFSLTGQIAWVVENMYLNVFIYKSFNATAADISYMVAASAVAATLTTVFMGALSDRVGKRKIFISGGYILWGISIFAFAAVATFADYISKLATATVSAASIGITAVIFLDCVMTFFGSTANDAAFNAWLTDSTTEKNRGAAEGINAMMPLVSILVVFGGFMFFDLNKISSWTVIFCIIGAVVLTVGILGLFIIKEPNITPSKTPYLTNIFYGFRLSTAAANPTLYVTLAAFIIFNISIQIFMPYLIIYYEVALGMTDYVFIMAPAVVLAAILTAFWGRFYDKKGFALTAYLSMTMLIAGYIILYFTRTTLPVFLGSLLMMSGYLPGMAVFGAKIRDNTPEGKSGRLQGIRIFSQVLIPGIVGPYIGKTVLRNAETIVGSDGTSSFVPNENIFLAAAIAAILLIPILFIVAKNRKTPRLAVLDTDFENDLTENEPPYADYPRPQLRRDSYLCLNGKWSFAVKSGEKIKYSGEILVPFVPESRISGVGISVDDDDLLVYERTVTLDEEFLRSKTLLHIGASDQFTRVFVNDALVGENIGGYLPIECDITDAVRVGKNKLRVEVRDPLDLDLPYGKQTKKRGGMWYTKVSGIWQTVFIESLPENYIKNIKITPDLGGADIAVFGGEEEKTLIFEGREYKFSGESFRLDVENPILWTPDAPHLYNFELVSGDDRISSYFGLRTVSVEEKNGRALICLNGKPIFCHGLLDQGYFSDGIFLPASPRGFVEDILKMKECGFNTLRKHIKLEPDLFYYYCDKYGMLVFQDMINSGRYSFLVDTALPTVGPRRGITHRASKRRRAEFEKTGTGILETLYNHPSVVYYTIFNEGWGQFDAEKYYKFFKEKDPTRVYDTTSGWFKTNATDVESDHIYFKPVKLKAAQGRAMVLSEFGGYACKIAEHSFNLDNTYGYRFFGTLSAFEDALVTLYENEIIPTIAQGLSASVLTQVSDVEDETNGLLTYDRRVLKVDAARLRALANKLYSEFEKSNK